MKVCVIGNSHIACLRAALNENPAAFTAGEITFFGAAKGLLSKLVADQRDRKLTAPPEVAERLKRTSGGLSHIKVDSYDAFLVGGLSNAVQSLVPTIASDRFSDAVKSATIRDFWNKQKLSQVIRTFRLVSDAPLFVMHAPLVAASDPVQMPGDAYASMISASQEVYFDEFSAKLLRQPDITLNGGMATRSEYSSGSVKLGDESSGDPQEHREGENSHMNAAFGGIMLQELAKQLTELAVPERVTA